MSKREYNYLLRLSQLIDVSGFVVGWMVLMWTWAFKLWDLVDALPISLSVGAFTYALVLMFAVPRFKPRLQRYDEAYDGMSPHFWNLTFAVMEGNKQVADVVMEQLGSYLEDVI
jgi:hypothetical protein